MNVQRLARFKTLQSFERQERENVPENVPEDIPEETLEPKKFNCEFADEAKARGGNVPLLRKLEGRIMTDLEFISRLSLSNEYECPRCGATTTLPVRTPGQLELFPPVCYNCGNEMRKKSKI